MVWLIQLLLLLWKYMRFRLHHWFLSTCEMALPILMIALIEKSFPPSDIWYRNFYRPTVLNTTFDAMNFTLPETNETTSSLFESSMNSTLPETNGTTLSPFEALNLYASELFQDVSLWYFPETNFTSTIMAKVAERLKPANLIPEITDKATSKLDTDFYRIGVIFELKNNQKSVPQKFIYKLYRGRKVGGLLPDLDSIKRVQLALNAEFIQLQVNVPESEFVKGIYLKSFPKLRTLFKFMDDWKIIILGVTVIIASFIHAFSLIPNIINEDKSGLKRLLRFVGVNEWTLWISRFVNSVLFYGIIYTILTLIIKTNLFGRHTNGLEKTDSLVLWCLLIMYMMANTSFCFLFASLFTNETNACSVFVMFVLVTSTLSIYCTSGTSTLWYSVSPQSAFIQALKKIITIEHYDVMFSWKDVLSREINSTEYPLIFIFLILLFQTYFGICLSFNISSIKESNPSSPTSVFFIFTKIVLQLFIFGNAEKSKKANEDESKYIQMPPKSSECIIELNNVSKNYSTSIMGLHSLNLKIYRNEITVILGNSGSGKSTLLSLLTGSLAPSSGTIVYHNSIGMDVSELDDSIIDEGIGYCSEENFLFPYLSVKNNLFFFSMMKNKGKKIKETVEEVQSYLELMNLLNEQNQKGEFLSDGTKRKTCLAVSLLGNPKILILDNPTANLDINVKVKIWNHVLALSENNQATIILSTNDLDETNILSDRIVMLKYGTLFCHGTMPYLRDTFDINYEVTVENERTNSTDLEVLDKTAKSTMPGIVSKKVSSHKIKYYLPSQKKETFSSFLKVFEKKSQDLGITEIAVNGNPVSNIYIKTQQSSEVTEKKKRKKGSVHVTLGTNAIYQSNHGFEWILKIFIVSLIKKYRYIIRDITDFIFRIILTTGAAILILHFLEAKDKIEHQFHKLSLSAYEQAYIISQNNISDNSLIKILNYLAINSGKLIIQSKGDSVADDIAKLAKQEPAFYETDLLFGWEENKGSLILYYPSDVRSIDALDDPFNYYEITTINLISNVFLANYTKNISISISTILDEGSKSTIKLKYGLEWLIRWTVIVVLSIDLYEYLHDFIRQEKESGILQFELMRIYPLLFWTTNIIIDTILFFGISTIRMFILMSWNADNDDNAAMAYNAVKVENADPMLVIKQCGILLGTLLLYTPTVFTWMNGLCLILKTRISYLFIMIFHVLGYFCVIVYLSFTTLPSDEQNSIFMYIVKILTYIHPIANFSLVVFKIIYTQHKTEFEENRILPPFNVNDYIITEIILSWVASIVFITLVVLMRADIIQKFKNLIILNFAKKSSNTRQCYSELDRVPGKSDSSIVLEVRQLILVVRKMFTFSFLIKDVSFSVKKGEGFGIIGTNGSGKSTVLKMLTMEQPRTDGIVIVSKSKFIRNKKAILQKIGYCTIKRNFFDEFTGRETCIFAFKLHGVSKVYLNDVVDHLLFQLGLQSIQHQKCKTYSSGNKKLLCIALSLIGQPNIVILDSPALNIDVLSKRRVKESLELMMSAGTSLVLASNEPSDVSTLCNKVAVIENGCFKSVVEKDKFTNQIYGFTTVIQLKEGVSATSYLNSLIQKMTSVFGDTYVIMVHKKKGQLHLNVTNIKAPLSEIFEKIELMKKKEDKIQDYDITKTFTNFPFFGIG